MAIKQASKSQQQPAKPRKPAAPASARADASPEEIRQLIEQAAYYKAKDRNFEPGHELEDWIAAEAEVRSRLEGRA